MATSMHELVQDRNSKRSKNKHEEDSEYSESSSETKDPPKKGKSRSTKQNHAQKNLPTTTPDKKKWYYAVARGRKPGVYTDWVDAEQQVNGYSGALYKKFRTRSEAQKWVDKHRVKKFEESEEEDGTENEETSEDERPRERSGKKTTSHVCRGETRRMRFPPLEIAAPDPSTGNTKELFRIPLGGEEQMATKLSPPGLDRKTVQELANATLDAIQLPGTSTTETTDSTGELVGALREMTEDRSHDWMEDRPQRDSLWRTAGRTSLLTIKSAETLQERLSEFAGIPEEMHEIQVHRFRAIFSRLHWDDDMIHAWGSSNWFLRIGKDTLDHYIALHLHLFTLANTEGWPYAQEALKHYGAKLIQFRKTNTCRLICLIKIYTFLRDARKNDFYSSKLQEKRNHAIMAKLSTLEDGGGGGGSGNAAKNSCRKCGIEHPGGAKKCWFRALPDLEAKKRMSQLMTKLGKMSSEEVANFLGMEE
jgi:hypothetical protein